MSQKHEWVNPHNEVKLLLHKIAFVALNKLFSKKLASFGKNNLSKVPMVQFLLTGPSPNKVKIDISESRQINKQENEWPTLTLKPMTDVIRCWTEGFKRRTHDSFLSTNLREKYLRTKHSFLENVLTLAQVLEKIKPGRKLLTNYLRR